MAVAIEKSKKERKHEYQLNRKMGFKICSEFFRCRDTKPPPDIEKRIQKHILPIRPGRSDKRKLRSQSFDNFLYRVAA